MRIAFIYTLDEYATLEKPLMSPTSIPFGISCLASVLKKEGHVIDVLVLTLDTPLKAAIDKFIDEFKPDLFALTAVASQFSFISKIAALLKESSPSTYIVLGGHHASLSTESCVVDPSFDALCIGEGDIAIKELVAQLEAKKEPSGINNLWIKNKNGVEKNPQNKFIADLNEFPFPEREMWDKWMLLPDFEPSVLISRGCPYVCTYCANHAMAKLADGKYVRYRSPENIVAEIQSIITRSPRVKRVYLEAETFGADLKMTFKICEALEEFNKTLKTPIEYFANFTLVKMVSANIELLEALQRANFTGMNVGLESGSERVRNGYLKRPRYKNEDLIEFCHRAKKYGIGVTLFVLMGVPGETLEDYYETVRVVREAEPVHIYLSIFYPYPGTDLWKVSVDLGLIPKEHKQGYERTKPNLDLPGFSHKQIKHEYVWFYYKAFKGKHPFIKVMARTFRTYLKTKPNVNRVFNQLSSSKLLLYIKQKLRSSDPSQCYIPLDADVREWSIAGAE